jgi:hypothetical protein
VRTVENRSIGFRVQGFGLMLEIGMAGLPGLDCLEVPARRRWGHPTPRPLRGANIGCADIPPHRDGEGETDCERGVEGG